MAAQWSWHRDRWTHAASAVEEANRLGEGLGGLAKHPTVRLALSQIDMAERAIASVANEMLCAYYDEPEGV